MKKIRLLLRAIAAFFDGFFAGLNRPPRSIAAYLESEPQLPQLPPLPAQLLREALTATELETIAAAETVQMDRERLIEYIDANFINVPEPEPQLQPEQMSRTQVVEALLDEAWLQGKTTYSELIAYVREQSGTGCSRRMIANWKEARKLNESQQKAA